jgi:putative membrane protein
MSLWERIFLRRTDAAEAKRSSDKRPKMGSAIQAAFESWSLPLSSTSVLVLMAWIYWRGWSHLRHVLPEIISLNQFAAFMGGLFSLWIAIASPLAELDDRLLTVHMLQHTLLLAVVPPLILLGAPAMPFLHGLPRFLVRRPVAWLLRWWPAQRIGRVLTHPAFGWFSATTMLAAWHFPSPFQLALRSEFWHALEHICFLTTAILFWWPVVQPWPSVARWPLWSVPIYLFLGMVVNDVLSAILALSDHVIYRAYGAASLSLHISPIDDQACAGAFMWAFGTFVYLVPAAVISSRLLSPVASGDMRPPGNARNEKRATAIGRKSEAQAVRYGN